MSGEVALIRKTGSPGNLMQGQRGCREQLTGPLNAALENILMWREAR